MSITPQEGCPSSGSAQNNPCSHHFSFIADNLTQLLSKIDTLYEKFINLQSTMAGAIADYNHSVKNMQNLTKIVEGNGKPGLSVRLALLEEKLTRIEGSVEEFERIEKELNKERKATISSLSSAIISVLSAGAAVVLAIAQHYMQK